MTKLKYIIKIVAIFLWSTNIRADYPFADEVSEELRDIGSYMHYYYVVKYLKSEKGEKFMEEGYRIASKKAKGWASDAKFVKFYFREPAEGSHKLEYSFISEGKGKRYHVIFGGWGLPGLKSHVGELDIYKTEFAEDYTPIDTSKWKVSIAQAWEKTFDTLQERWKDIFSEPTTLYTSTLLEMMNSDTLVWKIELFDCSHYPKPYRECTGFVVDATAGTIIRNKGPTQELFERGEAYFKEADYCNALKLYQKLDSHLGRYRGCASMDEVSERMIECMKKLEGKLPEVNVYSISFTTSSRTITESFVIRDSCWKNPVYYEVEEGDSVRVTCKIYGALGYRKKLTGKLPEYSVKVLKQRGVKEFDFAIQVKVGLDGKIEVRKHPIFLVGTGYTDWSYEIVKLLNETWRWQPLPVTTKGIIYFQFRPCES